MGRSPCCDKNGLKKGPWMPEEDAKLIQYIEIHGPQHWRTLPKNAGLQRCGKSCRLRWINYLRPDIKRGRFSFEEEETIIQLHSILGNKWSAIAARLPGRTDNEIKNYWNTRIRKRLLKTGIDPVTHSPRLDLLDLSSQLNLSNLLLQLQTLLNPQALAAALTLFSSNNGNHDFPLPKLQENHLLKSLDQPQSQASPIFQPNQFENVMSQETLSHLATSSFPAETLPAQAKSEHLAMNYINSCGQVFQDNAMNPTAPGDQTLPTNPSSFLHGASDQLMKGELPDISSLNSVHLSSPACPNSASTFVSAITEDNESESLCSSLLRFEIPDSLDLDYFM